MRLDEVPANYGDSTKVIVIVKFSGAIDIGQVIVLFLFLPFIVIVFFLL